MKNLESKKLKIFDIIDMNDYAPNSVVMKNIIKKDSGNVNLMSFDEGEELNEKLSRFDHFIQIIEGKAEILVNDKTYTLNSGQCIIIPANSQNTIKAVEKFKMISTILKSGYE